MRDCNENLPATQISLTRNIVIQYERSVLFGLIYVGNMNTMLKFFVPTSKELQIQLSFLKTMYIIFIMNTDQLVKASEP